MGEYFDFVMAKPTYDIFISYRRSGGAQYARILQLMLQQRGYKVFLDYDELTDGVFSEKIQAAIIDAPVFMLVLSKGSMERCDIDGDWVRREIMLAIEHNKHFVPIIPDNSFDGFPEAVPDIIKNTIGSHQHSDINFGQVLGVTIDLMVQNRLIPTLGERKEQNHKDEDYAAAQESLRKIDAHNRFMKRLGIFGVTLVVMIVLTTAGIFFYHHKTIIESERIEKERVALRDELEKKHHVFNLYMSPDLTETQMKTIDTILMNMVPVRPDTLWMSQFEFTIGQWHGAKGEPFDETQRYMPMTNVSLGAISMFLLDLCDMTNINFMLPSVEDWEYAARGGSRSQNTIYAGSNDVNKVAWYKDNANGQVHQSNGQQGKKPNCLDLYDMCGNVGECCNNSFSTGTDNAPYTVCGGDYNSPASEVTIASRRPLDTDVGNKTVGFRVIIIKDNQ